MESFFGILIFNSVINSKISIQTCILYEAKIRPTSLIHFISFSTHTRQPEDGQTKTSCPLNNHADLKQILEQSCVNWKNLSFLANNWTGCIPLQWTLKQHGTVRTTQRCGVLIQTPLQLKKNAFRVCVCVLLSYMPLLNVYIKKWVQYSNVFMANLSLPTIKYTWVFTRVPHGATKQWMFVCSQPSSNTQSG